MRLRTSTMAAVQALAAIMPSRTQVELQGILQSLRTWFASVDATNGASLRGMINGVLDIVPPVFAEPLCIEPLRG